jgi:hypothetical protein
VCVCVTQGESNKQRITINRMYQIHTPSALIFVGQVLISLYVVRKACILNTHSCQTDINEFVRVASHSRLKWKSVMAAIWNGIPVNGRWNRLDEQCCAGSPVCGCAGCTALHWATYHQRYETVKVLLAAGANVNVKAESGVTPVWKGAECSTASILQLLIDGGGIVNTTENESQTALIALAKWNHGDAIARLAVLLACQELDLDAKWEEHTAEEWALSNRHFTLAKAIANERCQRARWGCFRSAWVAAIIA